MLLRVCFNSSLVPRVWRSEGQAITEVVQVIKKYPASFQEHTEENRQIEVARKGIVIIVQTME